jgi:hypothetical protein
MPCDPANNTGTRMQDPSCDAHGPTEMLSVMRDPKAESKRRDAMAMALMFPTNPRSPVQGCLLCPIGSNINLFRHRDCVTRPIGAPPPAIKYRAPAELDYYFSSSNSAPILLPTEFIRGWSAVTEPADESSGEHIVHGPDRACRRQRRLHQNNVVSLQRTLGGAAQSIAQGVGSRLRCGHCAKTQIAGAT